MVKRRNYVMVSGANLSSVSLQMMIITKGVSLLSLEGLY